MPPAVLTNTDGHVMTVTINRPESRNAVNLEVAHGVGDALEAAERDQNVRAVVLTGAGEVSFCAGADLKAMSKGEIYTPVEGERAVWGFAGYVSHHISKPTIAAVNGFAMGGGTEIVLASDLVVACTTATFGLPEVKRGICAGAGGMFRLVEQIPRKLAMEMLLTGEPVSSQRALELGLVNAVVELDELMPAAHALAQRISANAPLAVQASKRVARNVERGRVPSEAALWELSMRESVAVKESADALEGRRAFFEKRLPVWSGT